MNPAVQVLIAAACWCYLVDNNHWVIILIVIIGAICIFTQT